MRTVAGYDYDSLLREVAERDEGRCFVRELLVGRRHEQIEAWRGGEGETGDAEKNWIRAGLLDCTEPWDAMHVLPKAWLKDEYPVEPWCPACKKLYPVGTIECVHAMLDPLPLRAEPPRDVEVAYHEERFPVRTLADLLNDPRNAVLGCRRHHNLMDRKLVVVRGPDLPDRVWEFAGELGDRAVARLERDYGPGVSAHGEPTRENK